MQHNTNTQSILRDPAASLPPVSPAAAAAARRDFRTDFLSRLEHRRRTRELQELAQSEGLSLPMPPDWIATLEALGYVVDLQTGEWSAGQPYWPGPALLDAPPALLDAPPASPAPVDAAAGSGEVRP